MIHKIAMRDTSTHSMVYFGINHLPTILKIIEFRDLSLRT
jgi:hypothetical protein